MGHAKGTVKSVAPQKPVHFSERQRLRAQTSRTQRLHRRFLADASATSQRPPREIDDAVLLRHVTRVRCTTLLCGAFSALIGYGASEALGLIARAGSPPIDRADAVAGQVGLLFAGALLAIAVVGVYAVEWALSKGADECQMNRRERIESAERAVGRLGVHCVVGFMGGMTAGATVALLRVCAAAGVGAAGEKKASPLEG